MDRTFVLNDKQISTVNKLINRTDSYFMILPEDPYKGDVEIKDIGWRLIGTITLAEAFKI